MKPLGHTVVYALLLLLAEAPLVLAVARMGSFLWSLVILVVY